jgi:hypothetical protein
MTSAVPHCSIYIWSFHHGSFPISLLSCGLLVHYCFSWSSRDEGGKAAWASFTVNTLRRRVSWGAEKCHCTMYSMWYCTVHAAERADILPLFLLYPYMYSVEYSMSGTSEHNRAKSRTTSHTTFLCIYCSVSSSNREQLLCHLQKIHTLYVHQAIFPLEEKADSVYNGQ